MTLQERLLSIWDDERETAALSFLDSLGAPRRQLSRGELAMEGRATASLLAEAGLRPGDTCLLVLPSDESCARALLGVLLAGGVPLLVAPPPLAGLHSDLPRILASTLARTASRLVVADATVRKTWAELERRNSGVRFLRVEDGCLDGGDAGFSPVVPPRTAVAAMQLTSGTTGLPRICVWRHSAILAALDGMTAAMRLEKGDVCLNWTPLYHDMGLVNNFFLCLSSGVPLVLLKPHDFVKRPLVWIRALSDTGASLSWSPNFGFALAAAAHDEAGLEGVSLSGVRGLWNAAERIHLQTIESFRTRFAPYGLVASAVKANFGCAENVGGATFSAVDGDIRVEHVDRARLYEERIAWPTVPDPPRTVPVVGVGRPWPGLEIAIGEDGRELPEGRIGEIVLRSPSRMEGYLGEPDNFPQGQVRTGDLGYLRGGELFWVGRATERINHCGMKIDPSDFEEVLSSVGGLRRGCFAAFGVDDPGLGSQRVVLVSELAEPEVADPHQLGRRVRRELALSLGLAVEVLLVPKGTLTKTSSGKRRHRYFRQLYETGGIEAFAPRAVVGG